jgi:hypothetical protein
VAEQIRSILFVAILILGTRLRKYQHKNSSTQVKRSNQSYNAMKESTSRNLMSLNSIQSIISMDALIFTKTSSKNQNCYKKNRANLFSHMLSSATEELKQLHSMMTLWACNSIYKYLLQRQREG